MEEVEVGCPFCGEPITVLVDTSIDRQTYIEDCEVCCRPIQWRVECEADSIISIEALRS